MKREEVRELFPDATDEQVDAILNKVGGELNPLKARLKAAEAERDEAKAGWEESRASEAGLQSRLEEANASLEAKMTDEERIAAREQAAEAREREFALKSNALDAKAAFVSAGVFGEEEIAQLVEQVTTGDAEATMARAKVIVDTVARQREAATSAAKADLLKANPKLDGASGAEPGLPQSRKEFLAMPYKEQLELKQANPDILSQLK